MRLDDDSALLSDWHFDPFLYMQAHRMDYAYLHAAMDDPQWTRRLWPFVVDYSDHHRLPQPSKPTGLSYFPCSIPDFARLSHLSLVGVGGCADDSLSSVLQQL